MHRLQTAEYLIERNQNVMLNQKLKALIAVALAFALTLSVAVVSYAQTTEETISSSTAEIWDGSIAESLEGHGTYADPYIISNGAELALATIRETYWGKHFKFTADIYLNDVTKINWTDGTLKEGAEEYKIREWSSKYSGKGNSGTFHGNGYAVYGLYISSTGGDTGLIPTSTGGVVFSDLLMDYVYISSAGSAGAFAGAPAASGTHSFNSCAVGENAYISGKDTGGFIGYTPNKNLSFTNCYSLATVSGSKAAGFIGSGWSSKTTFTNCYTNSNLIANTSSATVSYNNCYSVSQSGTGITVVTSDNMKGSAAGDNMLLLGSAFRITDGYPTLKVFTDMGAAVWGGFGEMPSANDSGVYVITNAEELYYAVSSKGNSKNYILENDIVINDITVKIEDGVGVIYGADNNKLSDTSSLAKWRSNNVSTIVIDGDGHLIRGLFFEDAASEGTFGLVGGKGWEVDIKNVGIEDMYANVPGGYVAAFIGSINSQHGNDFNTCYVGESVYIKAKAASGFFAMGGQSGSNKQTVTNSYVLATFDATTFGAVTGDVWGCQNTNSLTTNVYSPSKLFGNNQFKYESNCFRGVYDKSGKAVTDVAKMTGADALSTMPLGDAFYAVKADGKYPMLRLFGTAMGDVNEDGVFEKISDCEALRGVIIKNIALSNGDLDRSGAADVCDLVALTLK